MSKGNHGVNRLLRLVLATALGTGIASQPAQANPEGAQVVRGSASFTAPSADVLNIRNSNGAVINWQSFSIGPGQTTTFIQPSADSSVLNRVVGNNPSEILGSLNSNGRVFLINQNGLLVGEGATIDTAGFFGSTLNLTDEDFLKGRLKFEGGGQGGIVNRGYIRAAGGNIVLIAPDIENGGVIEVEDGEVLLASGRSIELADMDNPAIRFAVSAAEDRVVNLGRIVAERGAASLFAGTLKHSGDIRASGLVRNADGSISLVATDRVDIDGRIDVTGEPGGGAVDVRAPEIVLEANGRIDASATVRGDGGEVILFAEQGVSVRGEILARGGAEGGDGGFIETSGLQRLDIAVAPDAAAPSGAAGQWLIDPNNITISAQVTDGNVVNDGNGGITSTGDGATISTATIEAALNAGTNVLVQTADQAGSQEPGIIRVQSDISTNSATDVSLTLQAHDSIIFDTQDSNSISLSATGTGALNLILLPDSDQDGAGIIEFYTGFGNSFPITLNLNGGSVIAQGSSQVSGENGLMLNNSNWYVDHDLSIDNTAFLSAADGAGNTASLSIGRGGSLNTSGILSADVLVDTDGMLLGTGSVNGNVSVAGGAIAGGDGIFGDGVLNISGLLQLDRGLIYTVMGTSPNSPTILVGSAIVAGSISFNSADLMAVWDLPATATGMTGGSISADPGGIPVLYCQNAGCLTGNVTAGQNPFTSVVDPMAVTTSSVSADLAAPSGPTVTYSMTGLDTGANFVSWAGGSGLWNDPQQWGGVAVPQATDYVFLQPQDSSAVITLDTAETVAGMQLSAGLVIDAGGSLTLNGRSMTSRYYGGAGNIRLNAATASLNGSDVLYLVAGSRLGLRQGVITSDIVNWGATALPTGATVQLDGNLVSRGYFLLDLAGARTLQGTGSLFNAGILRFDTDANLQIDGSLELRAIDANASYQGSGFLVLNGSSIFNLATAPAAFDPAIRLGINGGVLDNAQNLILPDLLTWNSGTVNGDLVLQAGQIIAFNGSGDMTLNGNLLNEGTLRFLSAGGNLVLNGQLTNNSLFDLAPSAPAGITGTGSISQAASGDFRLSGGQTLTLLVNMVNAGNLFVDDSRFLLDGVALNQAAGSINIEGTNGELRVDNAGTLNLLSGVGINTLAGTAAGPVGSLTASASTIQLNDAGIDLSLLSGLYLYDGQLLGAGGATLARFNRLQKTLSGDAAISGTGTVLLPAGSTLGLGGSGGRISGIDGANLLLFDNAGTIDTGSLNTLGIQYANLQMSGDGVVTGTGVVDLFDNARLVAGQTTAGTQNFDAQSLYLRTSTSELVANGMVYAGNLGWYGGRISGSGLTTTGINPFVDTSQGVNSLATTWTIAAGSYAEWSGDNDLLLDGGRIVNRGELVISIAASGDGLKALTRSGATEILRNEGLLLIDARPANGVIEIHSGFDNAGGGIGLVAGTLKIDSNDDGVGDDLLLDQSGEFLQGFGSYDGSVFNQVGLVSPGRNDGVANVHEVGQLTITGDFVQGPGGLLRMDLDSAAQGLLADQLVVGGDLIAGGNLVFDIINNKSVLEIAALIDQSFRPFDIGGSFVNRFDTVTIPDGLNFTLGPGGVISITSDSIYLNLIADRLQALIDATDLTFAEVAGALSPVEQRIRLIRSRIRDREEEKRRRGGPRLVCR